MVPRLLLLAVLAFAMSGCPDDDGGGGGGYVVDPALNPSCADPGLAQCPEAAAEPRADGKGR